MLLYKNRPKLVRNGTESKEGEEREGRAAGANRNGREDSYELMRCIIEVKAIGEQSAVFELKKSRLTRSKTPTARKSKLEVRRAPLLLGPHLASQLGYTTTTMVDSGLKWLIFSVVLLSCSFVVYLCKLAARFEQAQADPP
jgi:hypothetical protein